jgi:3-oxoacyl-[acyl-carrier-protein] synthase II
MDSLSPGSAALKISSPVITIGGVTSDGPEVLAAVLFPEWHDESARARFASLRVDSVWRGLYSVCAVARWRVKHRVVITGIGAVTPIGQGAEDLWSGVCRQQSAVRVVSRFDPSPFRSRLAAEVEDFNPDEHLDQRHLRRLDRFSRFAVVAGLQAVADAALQFDEGLAELTGCYVGSALGGVAYGEVQHQAFLRMGASAVDPSVALSIFSGAASANIAIALGLRGPSLTNSNSCASGAIAIGEAFRLVRAGVTPVMLAGGSEAPLAPLTFGAFALIKSMSTWRGDPRDASRPFDAQRDGFVMGEGAAMLVLESLEHAEARKARTYAEVRGYGTTNDAYHMVAPMPDGQQAARAIRLALADACFEPQDVEYINAHASATRLGDRAEALAVSTALGEYANRVPISGTKGLYGHPLGASPAIETAISALAIARGFVPGTANLDQPDADNTLNVIDARGLNHRPRVVLKNAFGFGGVNAALVLCAAHH